MSQAPRAARAGLAAAALLLVLHALAYFHWTEDDAGISLRYAVNLVEGDGLVYNRGERVEAISNLGYVLLLAPVYAVLPGVDPRAALLLAAKLLGLAAALLALGEARRLARTSGLGPRATTVALLLVAGSGPFAAWAVGGLEVPFVAWASAALAAATAALAAAGESPAELRRARLATVALVLLRIDGFVLPLALAAALAVLRRAPRLALRALAPGALALAVLFGLRLLYYGEAWPNPVAAKVDLAGSLGRLAATGGGYLLPFLRLHGGAAVTVLLAILAIAPAPAPAPLAARRIAAAAAGSLALYTLLVGADWMPLYRFLVAAVIPLAVVLVAGFVRLGERIAWRPRAPEVVAVGLAALEVLAGHASFRTRRASRFWYLAPSFSPRALISFWSPAVDWLDATVPAGATLLTSEAGFIPYLSGLRTVDSFGLTSRAIAHLPRGAVERSTLGVHTRFVAGPPRDPAERLVAGVAAGAIVLQWRMVAGWNDGEVPPALFEGRFHLALPGPLGGTWAVYLPGPPGSEGRAPLNPGSAGGGSAVR